MITSGGLEIHLAPKSKCDRELYLLTKTRSIWAVEGEVERHLLELGR